MKRWMVFLILALLLTGCAAPDPTPTETTTPPTTVPPTTAPPTTAAPTQPAPQSTWVEQLDREYLAIAPMGNDLLLFGEGTLALYREGAVAAALEAPVPLPESGAVVILDSGIVYFDALESALVTLDQDLTETGRIALGATVSGAVRLSPDGQRLYYCTPNGVRTWDAESRIHRNIKLMDGNWIGVTGGIGDGAYLVCSLALEDGSIRTMMVSSESGETLYEGEELENITGSGDFFTCVTDSEWIFGAIGQQPQNLLVEGALPLPQLQMAVTVVKEAEGTQLQLYDLKTGLKIAHDHTEAKNLTAPVLWQGKLVFLAGDALCIWDHVLSPVLRPVVDTTVYTAYRYTADAPDHDGLEALQARADALSQQYGIHILMWKDIAAVQPAGYVFEEEYRTAVYEKALDTLEKALARFPEGFFKKAASWTGDGVLHIVLARSVTPPETECGSQYLLGWDAYVPLSMDESLEQTFYHGLGHVVDTLVLSKSHGFYEWHTVNPSGFQYDNSYSLWQERESKYLQGSSRYFTSSFAMTFPVEDRASLLEYAMMPGNQEVFESKHMQKKLKRLKTGLREAFDLEEESYPWERYLK